ncbi:MAG TPA: GtrA family protein [Alphaproteobacteria bacterium]|nr:GtrA family protein [Alphaproteobacteria bacterium]
MFLTYSKMNQQTKKQIKRFIICGGSAAITDFLTYYLFLELFTPSPSKALSFICGAVVAYFSNKFYTFEQKQRSYYEMLRFGLLYLLTFFVNVGSNKLSLYLLAELLSEAQAVFFSFVIATFITMCCNFIGQKFFVFKSGIRNQLS